MSVNKFKFVSPGVFVSEIDNSQLPALPRGVGPVVIGRSLKGPSMRPVQIDSFSEFVETFGDPIYGGGAADVWRAGPNVSAPGYGTYAAQAYLRNESPLVFVRLAGIQHAEAADKGGKAGWEVSSFGKNAAAMTSTQLLGGGFGLFIGQDPYADTITAASITIDDIATGDWSEATSSMGGNEFSVELTGSDGTTFRLVATGSIVATNEFDVSSDLSTTIVTNLTDAINNASGISSYFSAATAVSGVVVTSTEAWDLGDDAAVSSSLSCSEGLITPTTLTNLSGQSLAKTEFTGTLAAIFYARTGSVSLSGTLADDVTEATGTCGLFRTTNTNEYTALIKDNEGTVLDKVVFNFSENSKLFIRNVFNTNPALCNDDTNVNAEGTSKTYFLGETFERNVTDLTDTDYGSFAVLLGLQSGSTSPVDQHIQHTELKDSKTGWFFSQDLGTAASYNALNMQKLFRFVGIGGGEWQQNNLKISITNLTPSSNAANPYGYFTVEVRQIADSDGNPKPVEVYSDVDLNPNSPNFISRRIGDTYTTWDTDTTRYISKGDYVNQSRYIRVELDGQVRDATTDAKFLPFGVYGPTRWKGFTLISGGVGPADLGTFDGADNNIAYVVGNDDVPDSLGDSTHFVSMGGSSGSEIQVSASFLFPAVPTRALSNEGIITNQKDASFGATTNMVGSNRFEASVRDVLRRKPSDVGDFTTIPASLEYDWIFSLDDLTTGSAANGATAAWVSGSRQTGNSFTASGSYQSVLTQGFKSFTTVLSEGFEGINILEKEPFRNTIMYNQNALSSYEYASVDRAIDAVADAEVVECNMMSVPGLTNTNLTSKLLDVCDARADALAVIDLPGGYVPPGEEADLSDSARLGSVQSTIDQLDLRNINNSYGCAYYPWVQVTDTVTTGGSLWVPPSVVVLGTLASSQAASELWFAPAGFTRGGLTEGSAGLPVTNVRARLNSQERDDLYNTNINPIAQFPAEGIVIFGQKTLQVTRSALDRINVRRLMIYVKREISRIAATLLFEQNVTATWNRFLGKVNPFLGSIQTRLGLTDYKVLLDETTTTPDLIDRNILYAKIFLKPARAIEFIALDFVITRSGASFED